MVGFVFFAVVGLGFLVAVVVGVAVGAWGVLAEVGEPELQVLGLEVAVLVERRVAGVRSRESAGLAPSAAGHVSEAAVGVLAVQDVLV